MICIALQHIVFKDKVIQYFVLLEVKRSQKERPGEMKIGKKYYRSVWFDDSNPGIIYIIDQEKLPFQFEIKELRSVEDVYTAIKEMTVRGAPAIGVAGAFGMYLAAIEYSTQPDAWEKMKRASNYLSSCRPTAVNLKWAVNKVLEKLSEKGSSSGFVESALHTAKEISETEISNCRRIGINGLKLIEDLSVKKNRKTVNILTHCNAGWLACVDYGTALAPVYAAHEKGIPVHVWVDETRPRNQGARLTTYELGSSGVPYSLIADNTGGHLMQHGMVDLVLVGSDRTTRNGDVANKIGTYLKALAAFDNNVPFYVALPSSSIDLSIGDGLSEIEIEERDPEEITMVAGLAENKMTSVRICPENTRAVNYGFDITPARLVSGLITEKGLYKSTEQDILKMFSEK
jgi:methylthioribose-1-phosphate isomerase